MKDSNIHTALSCNSVRLSDCTLILDIQMKCCCSDSTQDKSEGKGTPVRIKPIPVKGTVVAKTMKAQAKV